MNHVFTVADSEPIDLNELANELRLAIDGLLPEVPKLKARQLDQQTGVQEFLVVIRGNEDPHIHPEGDLIISVLEGGGYVQLLNKKIETPEGSIVVVPKALCHAYYNLSENDSVLLATFSPINSKAECPSIF
jgi:oxalate decarboxylase/phosphoglucose isomerase-like protein (cupin superfamily)